MVVNVSRTALSSRRYPSGLEKSEQCSANIVLVPVVGRPRDALLPTCSLSHVTPTWCCHRFIVGSSHYHETSPRFGRELDFGPPAARPLSSIHPRRLCAVVASSFSSRSRTLARSLADGVIAAPTFPAKGAKPKSHTYHLQKKKNYLPTKCCLGFFKTFSCIIR